MFKEREAASHGIVFRMVGSGIITRDGAAAFDKSVTEVVGDDPIGGSITDEE